MQDLFLKAQPTGLANKLDLSVAPGFSTSQLGR